MHQTSDHLLHQLIVHAYENERGTTPPQIMLLFLFLLFSLLVVVVITARPSPAGSSHGDRLPPSPPRLPIVGHLHLVGLLPHVSLRRLAHKYGRDYMLIHLGSVRCLVVSSPRAAEAVLRTHDHAFASRPPSTVADALLTGSVDVAFAVYGGHWRQAKKLLTTHLLTVKKVQSYRPGRQEEVRLNIAKVAAAAAAGQTLDMSELLYSFTTDIMCRAVSGEFFKVDGRGRLFRELLDATAKLIGGYNAEDYFPGLLRVGFIKRAICARADKVRKRWDELLDKVIDDYQGQGQGDHQREPDFIQVLLSHQKEYGLTTDHIKAILIDIFFGGTDTSYLVLEFIMAELLRNPSVMLKLQEELRSSVPKGQEIVTEDNLANMSYLKAVIKETLRLHPPAPLLAPHLSMENIHIDGYKVPAKIPVLVNAWALGRDASIWEDAEMFKPERFMDTSINFKGSDFQFLPFGAGRRMCPGLNFSISTLEIMLGNLMFHFDWELPAGMQEKGIDMKEGFSLTVHRKEKLLLVPKVHA